MKIDHIMIRTGDIAKSIVFYESVLGMDLLDFDDRLNDDGVKYASAFMGFTKREGAKIELTYNPDVKVTDDTTKFGHLAIYVDDCSVVKGNLKKSDIEFQESSHKHGEKEYIFVSFKSPEGADIVAIQKIVKKKIMLVTGASAGSLGESFIKNGDFSDYDIINIVNNRDSVRHSLFKDVYYCDFSNLDSIYPCLRDITSNNESIHLYLNFTGTSYIEWFQDIDVVRFIESQNVNFNSFIMITKALLDSLSLGKALVIAVISTAANNPMRCSLSYNTSKAALQMAVRQLGREVTGESGVCFVGVNPSNIEETNMTNQNDINIAKKRGWDESEYQKLKQDMSPNKRLLTKLQVGRFIENIIKTRNDNLSGTIFDMGTF